MDLKTVKEKIRIVGSDFNKNKILLNLIQSPSDCFGMDYKKEYEECKVCTILADVDGRKEPVNVFCRELKEIGTVGPIGEDEIKPEEQDISWKLEVKKLYEKGIVKEEITNSIISKFPDVKPGKVSAVLNGYRFQKARMDKLNEKE